MDWDNDSKMNEWLKVHYHAFKKRDTNEQMLMRLADQVYRLRKSSVGESYRYAEQFLKDNKMTIEQADKLIEISNERGKKIEQLKAVNQDLYDTIEDMKKELTDCTYHESLQKALSDEIIGLKAIIKYIKEGELYDL